VTLNSTIERIGRGIRVGVVGGGEGALIGAVHRTAMRFDDHYEIVAGVLSRNEERSVDQGQRLGLRRSYGNVAQMLSAEKELKDGIDLVAIMTPNDTHASASIAAIEAGYHVICDKPIANDFEAALSIARAVEKSDRKFCVTYNYTGYPMVRQARAMIAAGMIGRPHLVDVRYAMGNLGSLVEQSADLSPQLQWRLDPDLGGANHLLLDVGTHAQNLATFVLERQFKEVFADVRPALQGRAFDDTAVILGRLDDDVRVTISVTKAATGAPQIFDISAFGDQGGICWQQTNPNSLQLMREGKPLQIYGRGSELLGEYAKRSIRLPYPHPEGFREAFANIYADFAEIVSSAIAKVEPSAELLAHPGARDGARSLAWVDACVRSNKACAWVDVDDGSFR